MQMHSHLSRDPSDNELTVHFYMDAIEDQDATNREGRPVYRNVERIRITGMRDGFGQADNTFKIETSVNSTHIRRFPSEYNAFKAITKDAQEGTPIKMWPVMTPAGVKELAAIGLFTVEQLAELSPRELRQSEWLKPYHEKAVNWMQSLEDNGAVIRLQAQVEELQKKVNQLEVENTELLKELVEGKKATKRPVKTSE